MIHPKQKAMNNELKKLILRSREWRKLFPRIHSIDKAIMDYAYHGHSSVVTLEYQYLIRENVLTQYRYGLWCLKRTRQHLRK
jgi:hypothetical protein